MRDQELERLTWQRIDGALSPEDRRRLDRYLEDHPEARGRVRQIEDLARLLRAPDPVAAPLELRPRIDRALAAAKAPRAPRTSVVQRPRAWPWGPRLAYVAAGVLIGVVATLLLPPGPGGRVSRDQASAAMGAAAGSRLLELDLAGGAGTLHLRRTEGVVTVETFLVNQGEVELVLEAEHGGLHLEALTGEGGAIPELDLSGSRLEGRIVGAGSHRLTVRLADASAPLDVEARDQGRLLARGRIDAVTAGGSR